MGRRRSLTSQALRALSACLVALSIGMSGSSASAEQPLFRVYGVEPGSSQLSGECMLEDRAGFLYICTEQGVFSFNGRQFSGLGGDQGLPIRHVTALAEAPAGRLVVRYDDEILVADRPASPEVAPASLHFQALSTSAPLLDSSSSLAPWKDGVALVSGSSLRMVSVPVVGAATVRPIDLPGPLRSRQPVGVQAVFNVDGDLWLSRSDGTICVWGAAPRCFGVPDGVADENWTSIIKGPDGAILARSFDLIATLRPDQNKFVSSKLPNQGGAYGSYRAWLTLFHTPDGSIMTQAAHGLEILQAGRWHPFTLRDGVPEGVITSSLVDRSGSLWLQFFGQGVARQVRYGLWQRLTHADGLSDGLPWMTARAPDGSVWVASDAGIDQIVQGDDRPSVRHRVTGSAYALASSAGLLWTSNGEDESHVIDPASGMERPLRIPSLLAVVPGGASTTWLATRDGIYRCDGAAIDAIACTRLQSGLVKDMVRDGSGGFFYLVKHRLRHLRADGTVVLLVDRWPVADFNPLAIAGDPGSGMWVGGEGGLFRVVLRGAARPLLQAVPPSDIGSDTAVAVLVDHRGWLWVGTDTGLSVYNGHRWSTLNTEDGLLSNDLDQRGLREDPDGSIWITSSAGISHLLHPEQAFAPRLLDVVISRASVDGHLIEAGHLIKEGHLPFNRKPLLIDVGTPGYSAEQSVTFRYRMSGVDDDWIETSNGRIFYPFVPPGRHRFEVFAYDLLKHRVSAPQSLTIDIAYPWWQQWWADALWACGGIAFVYGVIRLRVRVERARQAELERRVEEVTAEIRQAQAALAYQATHDQLPGLLNRSELETRLAGFLHDASSAPGIVVGLVDIDHFKTINDGWGHLTGDAVLREMGALSAGILRADEFAGRYGGEEILVVLRNGDGRAVSRLAAFHHGVRSHRFGKAGSPGVLTVTCSIGLAAVFRADNWETLIGRADRALYHAKRTGRDRIAGLAEAASRNEADAIPERTRLGDAT